MRIVCLIYLNIRAIFILMHEESNEFCDNIVDEPRPTLGLPEQPRAYTTEHLINEYEEQNKKNAELFHTTDSCKYLSIQTIPKRQCPTKSKQTIRRPNKTTSA